MPRRDLGIGLLLGAVVGAGGALWCLRDRAAPVPGSPTDETARLERVVADLERRLATRPAPLAPHPIPDAAIGDDDPARARRGPDVGVGVGGSSTPVARGSDRRPAETGADAAPPTAPRVEFARPGGTPYVPGADGAPPLVVLGGNGAPTPPLPPDEIRRLLDTGTSEDLVRAANALDATRDRSFLPMLVERVNRPEHRDVATRVVNTIASLKDRAWSALQATGAPDTPLDGDLGTAWASKRPEMGPVTLDLTYDRAVRVDAVRIHETLAPGAIATVQARAPDGTWETLWEGTSTPPASPTWFEPPVAATRYATNAIRLVVDTDRVAGWNEVDAVEFVGDGLRQWASGAVSTSSYADP